MSESVAPYDLKASPFFRLGTTPRDNRSKIVRCSEAAEVPPPERTSLRNELFNPRRRVVWEVAWHPGGDTEELLALLRERSGDRLLERLESMPISPLGRANLRAHCAADVLFPGTEEVATEWIAALANDAQQVQAAEVMRAINADREAGGYVPLTSDEWLASALADRQRILARAVRDVVDRLRPESLVRTLTAAAERLTAHGTTTGPALLGAIIDSYTMETEYYRRVELERIKELTSHLGTTALPVAHRAVLLRRLARMVRRWDAVAQPIQLSRQATGRDEPLSNEVASCLRELAIKLHNERGLYDESRLLMTLISDVFRELPVVANRATEDAAQIDANFYVGGIRPRPPESS